ncbi:MAG: GNAT family N-acetyltransferase, partial [Mycobacterium sp.]|nr:GNAT family N-acetyltransferase [Mycobacterium sp.]
MYQRLRSDRLKGGEEVRIGYVEGPDPEWMSRLVPFLGHKQPWFLYHISRALSAPLDDLRTRFYIGMVRDEIVAHIMVVSARGAGILGHVYTVPAWRRQGAVSAVMRAQMEDVADLDVVTLSTGYGGPAYRIYERFGFGSVHDGSGDMRWLSGREPLPFEATDCTVGPMRWDDWPHYS